ncbi:MAG: universal stress protein [Candidatus Vecturithrix sp.]|jgi:nucleotide-binding universal stress UspA family protein|nr:universal stress protein [Candidatus Vecturithrix sp.]
MSNLQYYSALQDFRRARRQAQLEQILAFLKGTSSALLSYEEVAAKLKAVKTRQRELREIPIDAIVGSVNRYQDFTRNFLPKRDNDLERWTAIDVLATGAEGGLPPIEAYQIGEVYFVYDGNHRVSVARQLGATVVEAYITRVNVDVELTPDIQPDELILKAEYADFLAKTHLDRLRSLREDFQVTAPGKYEQLVEQIDIHRYFMAMEQQREIPYQEAVIRWYDDIYLPLVQIIEEQGILHDIPHRTATDLYLWVSEHRPHARHLGILYDEAYITEIWEKIPPSSQKDADQVIIDTEYHAFLARTQIRRFFPDADLRVTVPGKYRILEDHISVHRYFMGLEQKRDIPYHEAVVHWYDTVYLPLVRLIQDQHMQDEFSEKTLTDLYLWISEHRSISRQIDASHNEIYVSENWANIKSFPYIHLDELIVKVEYIDFLAYTHLLELRPKADLSVSAPGQYRILEEHIDVHRYFMGLDQKREIAYHEAVTDWYDQIYLPVLKVIVEQHLLRDFPDLTATDLYLWISEHRDSLEKHLNESVSIEAAAADLVHRFGSKRSAPIFSRLGQKFLDVVGSRTQETERSLLLRQKTDFAERRQDHLFTNILVPINGKPDGWLMVEQALKIAEREEAVLVGLLVVPSEHLRYKETVLNLQHQFEQRCRDAGVQGELFIETGDFAQKICEYAHQVDLVLLHLLYASDSPTVPRLQGEFRGINRRCARSIFALSDEVVAFDRALLTYDGSQKAKEALFVSAYLAGCWGVSLVVLTEQVDAHTRSFAKSYLKRRNIDAVFVQQRGKLRDTLPKVMQEYQIDFMIIGSYGERPVRDFLFGRPVDQMLTYLQRPILICR